MAEHKVHHPTNLSSIVDHSLLSYLERTSLRYWLLVAFLASLFLFGLFAWVHQIRTGLGVTGLKWPIFWGVYIINFVFFIGISHAGTLISSILRIANVEWRRPFTRMAEAVTVFSLPFGALMPIVDLGRPDRGPFMIPKHPHITSPIMWDVICISTYLASSCIYFYLALIPDIAVCRDRLKNVSPFKRWLYRVLSLGWTGTERQWKVLDTILAVMSVFLFALVVSVHTNVSFVFGMTLRPGWHTAIIGPYFVLGAIFSGVAMVITIMVILRKVYRLENYLTDYHFDRIAGFLLALSCFWFYFTFVEHFMSFYWHKPDEMKVWWARVTEEFSPLFWTMFVLCFVLPVPLLAVRKLRRNMTNLLIVSILINIGMWLERFVIIVPSGTRPVLPFGILSYTPTWVEVAITVGWLAGFFLLISLFVKVFPVITLWELYEGKAEETEPKVVLQTTNPEPQTKSPLQLSNEPEPT